MPKFDNKPEQVLKLEPSDEIRFRGPFTDMSTSHLVVSNPTKSRIYFKVKTTAPKMYCVRPNNALLEPNESITVSIMLQPDKGELSESQHKFLIQSIFEPSYKFENIESLWKNVVQDSVMSSHLRCVFDYEFTKDNEVEKISNLERAKDNEIKLQKNLAKLDRHELDKKVKQYDTQISPQMRQQHADLMAEISSGNSLFQNQAQVKNTYSDRPHGLSKAELKRSNHQKNAFVPIKDEVNLAPGICRKRVAMIQTDQKHFAHQRYMDDRHREHSTKDEMNKLMQEITEQMKGRRETLDQSSIESTGEVLAPQRRSSIFNSHNFPLPIWIFIFFALIIGFLLGKFAF